MPNFSQGHWASCNTCVMMMRDPKIEAGQGAAGGDQTASMAIVVTVVTVMEDQAVEHCKVDLGTI